MAILWAGLLCGVLDISAAFITWAFRGVRPVVILRAIAGGLLGPSSFHGGAKTAALGLALHFTIAFSAAAVFYFASRKIAFMIEKPIISGVLYGVIVYLIMYWIVMPLSRVVRQPFSLSATIIAVITHMLCVGLPISLVMRHYSEATSS